MAEQPRVTTITKSTCVVQEPNKPNQLRGLETDLKKLVLKVDSLEDKQATATSNNDKRGAALKKRKPRKKKTSTSSASDGQINGNGVLGEADMAKVKVKTSNSTPIAKQRQNDTEIPLKRTEQNTPIVVGGASAVQKGKVNSQPQSQSWREDAREQQATTSKNVLPGDPKPKNRDLGTPKTPWKKNSAISGKTEDSINPSESSQRAALDGRISPKVMQTLVFGRSLVEVKKNVTYTSDQGNEKSLRFVDVGRVEVKMEERRDERSDNRKRIEMKVEEKIERKLDAAGKNERKFAERTMEKRQDIQSDEDEIVIDATPDELERLRRDHILPLKQRNLRFRFAKYRCHLCVYHLDHVAAADIHIKTDRHQASKITEMTRTTLKSFPAPTPAQLEVINQRLEAVVAANGISLEEALERVECAESLQNFCSAILPECRFKAFGSSVSRLGLKESDLNIGLWIEAPAKPVETLMKLLHLLNSLEEFYDEVYEELSSRIPCIKFRVIKSDIRCRIVLEPDLSVKSTEFLRQFIVMDDRYRKLTVCFRHWAKQCKLDDPVTGTLPPHAYAILTLYYLQQHDILPILHKSTPKAKEGSAQALTKPSKEEEEQEELGDEEEEEKDLDEAPEEPGLDEKLDEEDDGTYQTVAEYLANGGSALKPNLTLAELWVGLLRFYSLDFAYHDKIACVRQKDICLRADRNWGNKKMAIEDPFNKKQNMAACISNTAVHDYILDCLRNTYAYFATPQLLDGPMFKGLWTSVKPCQEGFVDKNQVHPLLALSWLTLWKNAPVMAVNDAAARTAKLTAPDFLYEFDALPFTRGKIVPVMCSVCLEEGHLKTNCPELQLPKIEPLPPMRPQFLEWLEHLSWNILRRFIPSPEHLNERQRFITSLENYAKRVYSDARLEPFGSSCNGFGFVDSDLDLCLTFDSKPTGEGVDMVSVVERLGQHLSQLPDLHSVLPIPSAKVPIVKLVHRQTNLSADISLYNRLGQHNSRLLRAYAEIDARVRALGFLIKFLAKECGVCEAARGSLSSYAYVLMLIHFLQQRQPPVLPVLQELYDPSQPAPERLCDGWNTWFFEDLRHLKNKWPYCQANKESVATLFLGFLRYYTEVFDFSQRVVCIRQLRPLSRLQKMWTERPLAIEDPFDLSHNLGSGVSPKMGVYIIKMLCGARRMFGTPIIQLPHGFHNLEQYLFCPRLLTDAPPPNDRGCIICGKIGHKARECPIKQRNKAHRQAQKSWKERASDQKEVLDGRRGPRKRGNTGPPTGNYGWGRDKGNAN